MIRSQDPRLAQKAVTFLDGFLHPSQINDEESLRLGRLQIKFGVLGGFMALVYSVFFFALGHPSGGYIVAACGFSIIQVPWLNQRLGSLTLTGHIFGASLVIGFGGLCAVGGGLEGHMNGWLAAAPVCALLLMRFREALMWNAVCLAVMLSYVAIDAAGGTFLKSYSAEIDAPIRTASYLGQVSFLLFLGLLFEQARVEALNRLKVANRKLARANEELTDLNRQKNEFLNIAAHDLKNPLSIICGYADLLRELESPTLKEIRNKASEILRSGNHMLDIISNILDVRKIEDGRRRISWKRCAVGEIVENLMTDYSLAATDKSLAMGVTAPAELPDAWADPVATRQLLDNLVSNAVKYTPHGGRVTISIVPSGEQLSVEVRDSGPGLSDDDQELLWEKFSRLTPRPTGNETSTGLGLWIVRRLAEGMRGSVYCRSQLGKGSTFGVHLPIWNGQEDAEEDLSAAADPVASAAEFDRLLQDLEARSKSRRPEVLPADLPEGLALPS
jgi:signal transduction histidine kinase